MNWRIFVSGVKGCPYAEHSPHGYRRWWARVPAGTAGALLLIGWAVGHLRDPGLWLDEAYGAWFATQPLDDLLKAMWFYEANMGPYYLVLHFWAPLVSGSEAWLRIPSVIGAAVAVWALSELVRRWTNSYAMAAGGGVVLALFPAFRDLAVDARAYSWSIALVVIATLAITRSTDGSLRLRIGTYGSVMGLAVALNLVAVLAFAVPASLIFLASSRAKWLGSLAGAASMSVLVFAPFAPAYWLNRHRQVLWIPRLSIRGYVANTFGVGVALTAVLLIAATAALALAAFPTFGRESGLGGVGDPAQRVFLVIAGVGTLAPPILLAIVSELIQPLMTARYLSFIIPFAVAATIGATGDAVRRLSSNPSSRIVWVSSVSVVIALLSLIRAPWSSERRVPDDFRSATSFLEASSKQTDAVVFGNYAIYGFEWYGFLDNRKVYGPRQESFSLKEFNVIPLESFEARADQVVWWVSRGDSGEPPANVADMLASLRDCRSASESRFGSVVVERYSPVESC